MVKEKITYPSVSEEIEILNRIESGAIEKKEPAVLSITDIDRVQNIAEQVYVDPAVKKYIADMFFIQELLNLCSGQNMPSVNLIREIHRVTKLNKYFYFMENFINSMRNSTKNHSIKEGITDPNLFMKSFYDAFFNNFK
jgi:hypothetical protein